jgi:Fic family protein
LIKSAVAKVKKEPRRSTLRPPPPPLMQYKFIGVPSFTGPKPAKYTVPPPPPAPPPPPPASLEERISLVQTRLAKQDEAFRQRYTESFDMSWIYHDSALEGVVYSFSELKTAVDSSATVVQDSSLQPVCEEIRRHKQAIEFVRDFAIKKRLPVTLDVVKRIYLILHPEEGDLKTLKYRKDIPQHRLYFHEYAPPDKIAYKVRQIVDWINDPETKRGRNALRIAARAHYDLVRVFPFTADSGKVARLLMNMLLMRAGYEPAIIHSTERQRYYEALKGSAAIILHMAQEAEENGLASIEKLLDEHETNTRSFVS